MSIIGAIGGIAGGLIDNLFGKDAAEEQAQLQREFAQNGIRWKVEDAKQAGIHPLYALGAQTTAYSPVSVGSTDFATGGQNLGSAIQAMTTPKEKIDGFAKTVQNLTLEKMGLENEVLRTQLRMVNQPGRGPGMPGGATVIDGQGDATGTLVIGGSKLKLNADTPAQLVSDELGDAVGDTAGVVKAIRSFQDQGGFTPHIIPGSPAADLVEFLSDEINKTKKSWNKTFVKKKRTFRRRDWQ